MLVPGKGVEPLTPGSTIQCSNQLSYPGPRAASAKPTTARKDSIPRRL